MINSFYFNCSRYKLDYCSWKEIAAQCYAHARNDCGWVFLFLNNLLKLTAMPVGATHPQKTTNNNWWFKKKIIKYKYACGFTSKPSLWWCSVCLNYRFIFVIDLKIFIVDWLFGWSFDFAVRSFRVQLLAVTQWSAVEGGARLFSSAYARLSVPNNVANDGFRFPTWWCRCSAANRRSCASIAPNVCRVLSSMQVISYSSNSYYQYPQLYPKKT